MPYSDDLLLCVPPRKQDPKLRARSSLSIFLDDSDEYSHDVCSKERRCVCAGGKHNPGAKERVCSVCARDREMPDGQVGTPPFWSIHAEQDRHTKRKTEH